MDTAKQLQPQQLQRLYDLSQDLIAIITNTGKFEYINPQWHKLLGWEPADMIGESFTKFIHPDDVNSTLALKSYTTKEEHTFSIRNRYRDISGDDHWLLWICTYDSISQRFYCSARDMTAEVKITKRLEIQQERYQLAVTGGNIGIFDWNMVTNKFWISNEFYRIIGYPKQKNTPSFKFMQKLVHQEDIVAIQERIQKHIETKTPYTVEIRIKSKSGEYRWFETTGKIYLNQQSKPIRMVGTLKDINAKK